MDCSHATPRKFPRGVSSRLASMVNIYIMDGIVNGGEVLTTGATPIAGPGDRGGGLRGHFLMDSESSAVFRQDDMDAKHLVAD
jgi:hypothetical protein